MADLMKSIEDVGSFSDQDQLNRWGSTADLQEGDGDYA